MLDRPSAAATTLIHLPHLAGALAHGGIPSIRLSHTLSTNFLLELRASTSLADENSETADSDWTTTTFASHVNAELPCSLALAARHESRFQGSLPAPCSFLLDLDLGKFGTTTEYGRF